MLVTCNYKDLWYLFLTWGINWMVIIYNCTQLLRGDKKNPLHFVCNKPFSQCKITIIECASMSFYTKHKIGQKSTEHLHCLCLNYLNIFIISLIKKYEIFCVFLNLEQDLWSNLLIDLELKIARTWLCLFINRRFHLLQTC